MTEALTIVIHGESGVGKSYLADTAPGPRVILDVEGGVDDTPSTKTLWDPRNPPPAECDTAVVAVRDLAAIQQTFQWLNQGQHPFRSVVIDSLTEMQKRAMDAIAGSQQMKTQDWGTLLRKMEQMVRAFRDLKMHPVKPFECVVFVCGSRASEDGISRPLLQGQMRETLPYYVDVVAHLGLSVAEDGSLQRIATFDPIGNVSAKARRRPGSTLGSQMIGPTIPAIKAARQGGQAPAEEVA